MTERSYWTRRIHSLLGIIPVGAFLFEHMLTNSRAIYGKAAYNGAVDFLLNLPYVVWLEIFFIFIPIAIHGIYGIYIALASKWNPISVSYFRNWMHMLQRLSGLFLIAYIGWHVWETRIAKAYDPSIALDFYGFMAAKFQNPWYLGFQALGVAAAAFHFANGLWSFLVVWGITVGERAQKWASYACVAVGALLVVFGVNSFWGFLKAGGL